MDDHLISARRFIGGLVNLSWYSHLGFGVSCSSLTLQALFLQRIPRGSSSGDSSRPHPATAVVLW